MRACSAAPRRLPSEISVILSRNSEPNANSLNRNRFLFSTVYTVRCTFLINSFCFIFRSAAPLCAARSLFLFLSPSVKRLKKKELKEEKLVGRIISVLSSKAFTLGGKLEKCYLPRETVPSNSRSVSILGREASTFPPNVAYLLAPAKIRIRNAVGSCCIDQAKGISNFPEWVVPVEAFWRNRYREDEGKR